MKRYSIPLIVCLVVLTGSSCGLLQPPASQPQLSATDFPPRATALAALPPTWTPVPTLTPSATVPPSPTPVPTQDPENYQISLVLTPVALSFPQDPGNRENWKELEGQTASLSIPPSYEVLDFAGVFMELIFGVMDALVDGLSEMALDIGEDLGATPQAEIETPDLAEMPEFDFLIAVEEASQSAIILVSVDIAETTTTEDLINQALSDSEEDFEPQTREKYLDAPYPMERVILDVEDNDLGPGKQILYVILGKNLGWNVVFTVPADLHDQYLPLFESTIQSFTIVE